MATLLETAYVHFLSQVTTDMTIQEFGDKLISDEIFNTEWSNGCTRELTFDERYQLAESISNVRDAKVQKYGVPYMEMVLNDFKIPKRVII